MTTKRREETKKCFQQKQRALTYKIHIYIQINMHARTLAEMTEDEKQQRRRRWRPNRAIN